MEYTELNAALVERFGDLERLCNQIYNTHHGVTAYIDEMNSLSFRGKAITPDWDYKLKRLKEVRHKRNQLSHGEISFHKQWANKDDIHFIVDFRKSIMNQSDPLSLYHRRSQSVKPFPYAQKTNHRPEFPKEMPGNNSAGCFAAIISVLFVVACIIAFLS